MLINSLGPSSLSKAREQNPLRVLIFSAPFGSGHETAARRLKEVIEDYLRRENIVGSVVIKNTMEFAPRFVQKWALRIFSSLQADYPRFYTWFFERYIGSSHHVQNAGEMKLFRNLHIHTPSLKRFCLQAFASQGESSSPTLILSTWPGATEALIHLRHQDSSLAQIPLGHMQTDNASQDRYFQLFASDRRGRRGADMVFVPSWEVSEIYKNLGLQNVVLTGMPLRLQGDLPVYARLLEERKLAKQSLNLDTAKATFMIEAGKNGAANYAVIVASLLLQAGTKGCNVIAACGESEKNQEMLSILKAGAARGTREFRALYYEMEELVQPRSFKNLLKKGWRAWSLRSVMSRQELRDLIECGLPEHVHLRVHGFVPLEPLRAAADIVITKPGGLSTAELAAQSKPMVILQEYASGEALPNAPLFEQKNLAIVNDNIAEVGAQAFALLARPAKLASMHESAKIFRQQNYLERVLPFVEMAYRRAGGRQGPTAAFAIRGFGVEGKVSSSQADWYNEQVGLLEEPFGIGP